MADASIKIELKGAQGVTMPDYSMEPHELWDKPWEGLPPDESPWERDEVSDEENGPTKNPPNRRGKWVR
jgi:hypothetical protein